MLYRKWMLEWSELWSGIMGILNNLNVTGHWRLNSWIWNKMTGFITMWPWGYNLWVNWLDYIELKYQILLAKFMDICWVHTAWTPPPGTSVTYCTCGGSWTWIDVFDWTGFSRFSVFTSVDGVETTIPLCGVLLIGTRWIAWSFEYGSLYGLLFIRNKKIYLFLVQFLN